LKTLIVSITALLLNSCKRILTPTPAPTAQPTAITKPTLTTKPSPTPTPQLPDLCAAGGDRSAETYLFGSGATRVKETEPGLYQIVIDKNINPNAFRVDAEFIRLGVLNPNLSYKVLWLDTDENVLGEFDANYNALDQQFSAIIKDPSEGDSGQLIPAAILTSEQADICLGHPDFNHRIMIWNGVYYLLLDEGVRFERVLVKSWQSGDSSGAGGSSASGGGTPGGGVPGDGSPGGGTPGS
jgi:uncharacterized membrane protein YgcG